MTPAERLTRTLETLIVEPAPPDPVPAPAGLNPATVYQVPIRAITLRRPVQVRPEGEDFAGLDKDPIFVTEWVEKRLNCPDCRSHTDLALQGAWGETATVVCACGYTWPAPLGPATSVHALQTAIARSAEQSGGLPGEPA